MLFKPQIRRLIIALGATINLRICGFFYPESDLDRYSQKSSIDRSSSGITTLILAIE